MNIQQKKKISVTLCVMAATTILLMTLTMMFLGYSSEKARPGTGKTAITLNTPWKFKTGDNIQWSQRNVNDSEWETIDLTAPPGAHDDDVGLSGFVPGWTSRGHPTYSGFAWYRMNVSLDSVTGDGLALAGPPMVDDAYQLFINGSLLGGAGDFSGNVPAAYSIQPRMFLLPENVKKEKNIVIAFRVWMSSGTLKQGADAGGIHIAPTLGEKTDITKKYRFQWEQTIKGYIVEVVLPVIFILLAITIFLLYRSTNQTQSCKWIIAALVLLALVRLNQAVYFWFQVESRHQADIVASVVLRPLILGCWLMAWWEWFDLRQPKWIPAVVAILTLLYMVAQLFALSWVSTSATLTHFQTIRDLVRLSFLPLLLFIIYQGIRKQGAKDWLLLAALLFLLISLFPTEVSTLHIIPGIWFPYGVGVSRTQYFYAAFVIVMYLVLIRKYGRYPALQDIA